jgi:ferredoxin-NADP reductase
MAPDSHVSRVTDVEVRSLRREADGVVSLTLQALDGASLPPWDPGAHVDLIMGDGLERQYSLCGSPADGASWRIAVLLEPDGRGGSRFVHEAVRPGTRLAVRGPRNHFPLVDAHAYRFVAGGIGITPIIPMLQHVEAAGREWQLLYGGRRADSMAFVTELPRPEERVTLWPQDEQGLLKIEAFLGAPRADTAIYCCGPEPLLQAVEAVARRWPADSLHTERFAPADGALDGVAAAFDVVCEQSRVTVSVGPHESIAEALEAAGIDVETSCREGTCGTCETAVLEGEPDHRDSVLSSSERASGNVMMICCSRSSGPRLVLDI